MLHYCEFQNLSRDERQEYALQRYYRFEDLLRIYRKLLKSFGMNILKSKKWNTYEIIIKNKSFDTFTNLFASEESCILINELFKIHKDNENLEKIRKELLTLSSYAKEFYKLPRTDCLRFNSGFIFNLG